LGIALFCKNCGRQIDLDDNNRATYSTFSVVESMLAKTLESILGEAGFSIVRGSDTDIASVYLVGALAHDTEKTSYEFAFVSKPLNKTTLYALIGHSVTSKRYIVTFYATLSQDLSQHEVELLALPRVQFIPISKIVDEHTKLDITRFMNFAEFMSSIIYSLNQILDSDQSFTITREEMDFLKNAKHLSRTGRERFEPMVVRLLQTLGFTSRLREKGYGPDGALFLPNGFYIIDAKSTASYFKFKVDERDKILRYIRTLEDNASEFGEYPFFGEVIVIPSLPEPSSRVLDKVEKYFLKNPVKGHLVVVAVEGLLELHRNAFANPEFFHRLDYRKHPIQLLKETHRMPVADRGRASDYSKVVYIDESALQGYYATVMKSPIAHLDGRSKEYLTGLVSRAYE
jgi:hypothetical protein